MGSNSNILRYYSAQQESIFAQGGVENWAGNQKSLLQSEAHLLTERIERYLEQIAHISDGIAGGNVQRLDQELSALSFRTQLILDMIVATAWSLHAHPNSQPELFAWHETFRTYVPRLSVARNFIDSQKEA